MLRIVTRANASSAVFLVLFLLSTGRAMVAQQQASISTPDCREEAKRSLLVLDAPSTESAGADSLLSFNALGHSSVFFGANHKLEGLSDIACSSVGTGHIVGSLSNYSLGMSELLAFDQDGRLVRKVPFGQPGDSIALAFDRHGNFYATAGTNLYKNGVLLTNQLSSASEIGKIAVDSQGHIYVTLPITSQLLRVDPTGIVTVFADATEGLSSPYGLAIGSADEVYVANNPPSQPAAILKFDPSGVSVFASNISSQPGIRGLAFVAGREPHQGGKLYATLAQDEEILEFDQAGNSSVYADVSDGLDFPAAVALCPRH